VIGFLSASSRADRGDAAFRQGLAEAGLIEGQSVAIEYRWAEARYERLPSFAAELASRRVDLIFAHGGSWAVKAAKAATSTIPIVFAIGDTDPVQAGLVESLSRPGANITGASMMGGALGAKRVGLLRDLLPNAATIGLFANPNNQYSGRDVEEVEAAVRVAGLKPITLRVGAAGEFDAAFTKLTQERGDGFIVTADVFFTLQRKDIIALAARHRLPAIYQWRFFPADGGLMSYGTDIAYAIRQAGIYAGRILKGAKPIDLPVLQPTKFAFVINLNTAKSLGLTIPPGLLAIADEVIE
jgi:putative tryptophan/tyrosine transport system substrate-binding protein